MLGFQLKVGENGREIICLIDIFFRKKNKYLIKKDMIQQFVLCYFFVNVKMHLCLFTVLRMFLCRNMKNFNKRLNRLVLFTSDLKKKHFFHKTLRSLIFFCITFVFLKIFVKLEFLSNLETNLLDLLRWNLL